MMSSWNGHTTETIRRFFADAAEEASCTDQQQHVKS